jgi:transcription termination factor Rho
MYDIIELNGKLLQELKEIAKKLNIEKLNSMKKQDLVFKILNQQDLISPVEEKEDESGEEGKMRSYLICPNCGIRLIIQNELIHEKYLKCLSCGNEFLNPLISSPSLPENYDILQNYSNSIEIQKNQFLTYATIATIGFGFLFPPIWFLTAFLVFFKIFRK